MMDETLIAEIASVDPLEMVDAQPEGPKRRLSLFRHSQVEDNAETTTQPSNNNPILDEYLLELEREKDEWIRLYNEAKGRNGLLKKELKVVQPIPIDYGLFTTEEMQFMGAQPDYDGFVRQVFDLQQQLQVSVAQHKCLMAMFGSQLSQGQAKVDHLNQVAGSDHNN